MFLEQLSGPVTLEIPSDPSSLFLVRGVVEKLALRMGFNAAETGRMVLAVDEACTNVIRHAYGNRTCERIVLTFRADRDRLEILVRDFGPPADPQCFVPRDLGDVRPGGLGMHFIRSAMDEVEYVNQEGGGMLLKLIKYRTRKEVANQ
ncbi:MAG: ATP-binding protein [Desulfobacteraceae bacterium]|nr:ATP-binding protein [Desulfobacteraceae bacterium]